VFLVKPLVGQIELFPKCFPVKKGFPVKAEDVIGGGQDRSEVVHEGTGPIKDDVSDHDKKAALV
jgi:hypothetical protein